MNKKNIFISSVQGEFQEEAFKVVLYRKTESTDYVTDHVTDHVKKLITAITGELSNQKYRLTEKGEKLKQQLTEKRKETKNQEM